MGWLDLYLVVGLLLSEGAVWADGKNGTTYMTDSRYSYLTSTLAWPYLVYSAIKEW